MVFYIFFGVFGFGFGGLSFIFSGFSFISAAKVYRFLDVRKMVAVVKTYFFIYFNMFSLRFRAVCLSFGVCLRFKAVFYGLWLKVCLF